MKKSLVLFCLVCCFVLGLGAAAMAATLTLQCDEGLEITGGRFFDTDSLTDLHSVVYYVGSGSTVSVELGDPEETPGYNLQFLQVDVQLPWTHTVYNNQTGRYEQIHYVGSISNQAACNTNIEPVNGEIVIRVFGPNRSWLTTGCEVTKGTIVPTDADEKCHYDCESWNPASQSCVGAPMNGCK